MFSMATAPTFHSHQHCAWFQFLPILASTGYFSFLSFFYCGHPSGCEMAFHMVLTHFALVTDGARRHVLIDPLCIFFREISIQVCCPVFHWVAFLLLISVCP